MAENIYLGVDVGSVSVNIIAIDQNNKAVHKQYLKTGGKPVEVINQGMKILSSYIGENLKVKGVGVTGSGRQLAGYVVGADVIKNEITAHATAALKFVPDVKTILEIGGQDSKIIFLENGIVTDFAMNTICAAGTGSFLDRQAARLNIEIEELGNYALMSENPVRIAGRCAVFAESDMVHKQQAGHNMPDIIRGLCEAIVRNYLNNLAKSKNLSEKIVFQGGVAANKGIVKEFERALNKEIIIPEYYDVMGAYGVALIAKRIVSDKKPTLFKGFEKFDGRCRINGFECNGCSNMCEILEYIQDGNMIARWGDRCGKWSSDPQEKAVI